MTHSSRRSSRTAWPLLLALAALALLVVAAPALGARVSSAPATVKPGQRVVVKATGFVPGTVLGVTLSPTLTRGGNCCGTRTARGRADAQGRVRFVFRWPARYTFCAGATNCSKVAWKRERADIRVQTTGSVEYISALRTTRVIPKQ